MPKKDVTAEDRLNISISLVSLLLSEGEVPLPEAALHFGISEKLMREIVRTMNEAEDISKFTSFFYVDLDLLDSENRLSLIEANALTELPTMTRQQTLALAAGLDYLAGLPTFAVDPEMQQLQQALVGSRAPQPTTPSAIETRLAAIQNGITQQRQIRCRYVNQLGETRLRNIQPLRIDFVSAKHYLRGVCQDSQLLKSFRVDRISEIEILDDPVTPDAAAIEIPDEIYGSSPGSLEVRVRVAPEAREFLWGYPLRTSVTIDSDGFQNATLITGSFATLGRQVLRHGGKVEVIGPPEARAAVLAFARRVIEQVSGQSVEGVE